MKHFFHNQIGDKDKDMLGYDEVSENLKRDNLQDLNDSVW